MCVPRFFDLDHGINLAHLIPEGVGLYFFLRKFQQPPWNIPQTLNYPFMKEILNHICIFGYLGSVGIFLEFYILIGQIASWEAQKTQPQS